MQATKHLPHTSGELGVAVYAPESFSEKAVAIQLLAPDVRKLVRRIDFTPLRLLFLNSIQIHAVSELISPNHCANQVQLLRALLLTIYRAVHDAQGV